jgi:hypothetical protein
MDRRNSTRLLVLIAVTIVVVLVSCLVVILIVRSGVSESPESVADDYQMSLIRSRYGRAYAHLSPGLAGYPSDVGAFTEDLRDHQELPRTELDPCVHVESVVIVGDEAEVRMRLQYYDPCLTWLYPLFPSLREGYRNLSYNEFAMRLRREGEEWKVVDSAEHFVEEWR